MKQVTIAFIIGGIILSIFMTWLAVQAQETAQKNKVRLASAENIDNLDARIKAMNAIYDEQIDKPFG